MIFFRNRPKRSHRIPNAEGKRGAPRTRRRHPRPKRASKPRNTGFRPQTKRSNAMGKGTESQTLSIDEKSPQRKTPCSAA